MESPAVTIPPAEPTPAEPTFAEPTFTEPTRLAPTPVAPPRPAAPRVAIAAGALALVLGAAGMATLAGTDAARPAGADTSASPAPQAIPGGAAPAPAQPDQASGAAARSDAARSDAEGHSLAAANGTEAATSASSGSSGAAGRRDDSGRIGRWQQMGHEHSGLPAERRAAASPFGVLLLGDSSLTRTRPGLVAALAGRPATWDHWNGRPTHGSVDVAAAIDGAGRLPRTLVVLSGSNDIFFPDGFAAQVERLMSIAGPTRRVVWVAPYVRRPKFAEADRRNSAAIDSQLDAAAARHPNLHVVDWAGHVRALPPAEAAALMPDGAHPSPAGCAQLTRMIVATLS